MLGDISKAEHIYIAVCYADMRKQIDGLSAIVHQNFNLDSFSKDINLLPVEGVMSFFVYAIFLTSHIFVFTGLKMTKRTYLYSK